MQPKTYQTRIYYEDTDCGGFFYHAKYLKKYARGKREKFFFPGSLPPQNNKGFFVKKIKI